MRIILIALICGCLAKLQAEDRLYVAAEINGRPAVFLFDTGSSSSCLWTESARRLGFTNILAGGEFSTASTEPATVRVGGTSCRMWFEVIDLPPFSALPVDGIIGWKMLRNNILRIDAEAGLVAPLDKLPPEARTWTKIPLGTNATTLLWEAGDTPDAKMTLYVDTGLEFGVSLPASRWQAWRAANANQPLTVESAYVLDGGWGTFEESWANTLALGKVRLTETPVAQAASGAGRTNAYSSSDYEGFLGMAALRRLEVIVDGSENTAYIRPKDTPATPYRHSRIGAGFLPVAGRSNEVMVAHVLTNSAAYKSGLRDGDMVLSIDGRSTAEGASRVNGGTSRDFTGEAPGTKIVFNLKRGTNVFDTTVILEQILGPSGIVSRRPVTNDLSGATVHLNSNDADDFVERGGQYLKLGRPNEAITDCEEALWLDPNHAQALYFRAAAYFMKGNLDKAIADVTKSIRLNGENSGSFELRANAYTRKNEFENARRDLTEAIRLNPQYAAAYLGRGVVYLHLTNYSDSLNDLTQAIRLDPKFGEAYESRAYLFNNQGRYLEAVNDYRQATILNPTNAMNYYLLATLEATCPDAKARNGADAVTAATKACELTEWKEPSGIHALAAAYAESGDFKRAIELEQRILGMAGETEADLQTAREQIALYEKSQPYRIKR